MELVLFIVRIFHSITPMDARLAAQEESLDTLESHINELRRLTVFFLMEQKRHVDRLAALCKADQYFSTLRSEGTLDFINILTSLSLEAEIDFIGDSQSPEGKLAIQILIGLDIMMSIYNFKSILSKYHHNNMLTQQEIEGITREIFLTMRNLGFFIIVSKATSRDAIDTEIATIVLAERYSNTKTTHTIRDYDARRYSESYEKTNQQRNSWFSEHLIPRVKGSRKGGAFNIKDHLLPFLEQLMADTGADDLPSVCAAIKDTCKETEPLTPGEMLFHWDDEPDAKTVRAVWMNNKKERKSEKVALKTLNNYIRKLQDKIQKNE